MAAIVNLADYQFQLGEVPFGLGYDVRVESLDLGTSDTRTGDADGYGDFRRFGRDRKTPQTWSFVMHTRGADEASALESLARLEAAWDAETERGIPGAVVPLRYQFAGRTRVVFGRPRNFHVVPATSMRVGHLQITGDFDRVDTMYYEDVEQSATLGLGASSVGGYKTPWVTPLRSLQANSARVNQIYVGGTAPTWGIIEFTGGMSNPWVEVSDWRVQLTQTIPYDDAVRIDPRPWKRTVTRKDGAHVPGWLSVRSRMGVMKLDPGYHEARFGASGSVGDVLVKVRWFNAHKSL